MLVYALTLHHHLIIRRNVGPDHPKPVLRRSLIITFLSTNGATAVHLVVTIVLARLLQPEEIGIFSITAVLVAIAQIFRDFGVGAYLEREEFLDRDKVGAAFGILLTSSILIATLVVLASPHIASFYGHEGIESVMKVLALGFVLIPFGSITNALLTRDYRATEQAYVYVVGTTAYAVTAIGLAWAGFSYMSMAWANLANIIATGIALLPFRPSIVPWLPRFRGWKRIIGFSSGVMYGNALRLIDNAIPDLILGKLKGPYDVGLLSRSMSTTQLVSQVLNPTVNYAALPYLSRTHHRKDAIEEPLLRAIAYVTAIIWPSLIFVFFHAEEIVRLLYGPNWIECVPLIKILCLAAAAGTPLTFASATYAAVGKPYAYSNTVAIGMVIKLVSIWFIYDGTLTSFAWAIAIAATITSATAIGLQQFYLGVSICRTMQHLLRSTAICIFLSVINWAAKLIVPEAMPHMNLFIASTLSAIAWCASLLVIRHPLLDELTRIKSWLKKA